MTSRPPSPPRRHRRRHFALVAAGVLTVPLGLTLGISPAFAQTSLPPPPPCSYSEQYPTANAGYGIPIANRIVDGNLTQGTTQITNINATVCGLLQFPSLSADIPEANIQYQNPANLTAAGIVGTGSVYISASGPSTAVTSDEPAPNGGLVFTLTASTLSTLDVGAIKVSLLGTVPTTLPTIPSTLPTIPSTLPTIPSTLPSIPSTLPSIPSTLPTVPGVTLPTVPHLSPDASPPSVTLPTIPGISIGPGGVITLPSAIQCNVSLTATLHTDPSDGGSPLVGPLTGAQGIAFAPEGQVSVSALTPTDPNSIVDTTFCPILSIALGTQSNTNATFEAPIDFYSTLTSFGS